MKRVSEEGIYAEAAHLSTAEEADSDRALARQVPEMGTPGQAPTASAAVGGHRA